MNAEPMKGKQEMVLLFQLIGLMQELGLLKWSEGNGADSFDTFVGITARSKGVMEISLPSHDGEEVYELSGPEVEELYEIVKAGVNLGRVRESTPAPQSPAALSDQAFLGERGIRP